MKKTYSATVLAVGTELTTGQIINRNAAWISEVLDKMGIEVLFHLTVPDERERILEGLKTCANASELLFVTGGLGPTTDDFTRNIIAEWLDTPLEFNEESWKAIEKRGQDLRIKIAPSNRQQCYFPKEAIILPNPAGTAAGFSIRASTKNAQSLAKLNQLWVLPGPPLEIKAIWDLEIQEVLKQYAPDQTPTRLLTWQCMGKSEAELGEMTETALAGSGLKTGYRAHRPYIEVKVWVPQALHQEKLKWLERLDQELAPFAVSKNGDDIAKQLLFKLRAADSVEIFDSASGGYLSQRLSDILHHIKPQEKRDPSSEEIEDFEKLTLNMEWADCTEPLARVEGILSHAAFGEGAGEGTITLALCGFTPEGLGAIGLREGQRIFQQTIQTPYKTSALKDRMKAYLVETAFKQWGQWLDSTVC